MRKKKAPSKKLKDWNFKDIQWCIDNDFQVYIKPQTVCHRLPNGTENHHPTGKFYIAVRRGGITTEGKNYIEKNHRKYVSKETVSNKVYNSEYEAHLELAYTYRYLRNKYGV